jgi:biotin operon repressor
LEFREAQLLEIILKNSGLGQNELTEKLDCARETVKKNLDSLKKMGLIVDKGKRKKGVKQKWYVVEDSKAKQVLVEQNSKESLKRDIDNYSETRIEIPFTRIVEFLTRGAEIKDNLDLEIQSKIRELAYTQPVIQLSILKDESSPIPNEHINEEMLRDFVLHAFFFPLLQLNTMSPKFLKDPIEIERLSKLKYKLIIQVDYSKATKWIQPLGDYIKQKLQRVDS